MQPHLERSVLSAAATLTPISQQDVAVLRELADTIWRQHSAVITPPAQIDYMLAGRFSDEALQEHIQATDRWLELLRVGEKPVGSCGYELAGLDGNESEPGVSQAGAV